MEVRTAYDFDEEAYLEANPEVVPAIAQGTFTSGRVHWEVCGRAEGRRLRNRRAKLREGLDLAACRAVEVGALSRPTVTRDEVAHLLYVDYAEREVLGRLYRDDPEVDVDALVDVDVIWAGESLRDSVPLGFSADVVLASHVIEHVPDPVTWLQELAGVLQPTGVIRLVVPDKRYTFDVLRQETTLVDLLASHVERRRMPSPRQILDFMLDARDLDHVAAWHGRLDPGALTPKATPEQALHIARDALHNGSYHDVHCSVFSPASFAGLLGELAGLGLLGLRCTTLIPTEPFQTEFFVEVVPCADPHEAAASWQLALESAVAAPSSVPG